MSTIRQLENQYLQIDKQFAKEEFLAHAAGNTRLERYWSLRRELNTHAYFLFAFTRLEAHLVDESTRLILDKRRTLSTWDDRAIWDNTDEENMHLKKRVGLLTEKGETDYNQIMKYFKHRKEIAHGGSIPKVHSAINMFDFFRNLHSYLRQLKK